MLKLIHNFSAVLAVVLITAIAPAATALGAMPGIDPSKGIDGSHEGLNRQGVPSAPISETVIDSSGGVEPCDEPSVRDTKYGAPVIVHVYPATPYGNYMCAANGALPYVDPETSRTMVPLRDLMENIGANVTWDQERQTAIVERNGIRIEMPVGSSKPTVNGQEKEIDAPAVMYPDEWRVFVPLRFVTETFGAKVSWTPRSLDPISIDGKWWEIGTARLDFPE